MAEASARGVWIPATAHTTVSILRSAHAQSCRPLQCDAHYPANLCLCRGVDLEAQIVDCSLCFRECLVLFDCSDDTFVLDSLTGGRRLLS
jgi:hypothetical protein